ncbi:hypothetical protein G9A89_009263 [Geosiphon pyriformis]|nr:hypothetical protein G9A89_009263 [Geosiphon pyriformis]
MSRIDYKFLCVIFYFILNSFSIISEATPLKKSRLPSEDILFHESNFYSTGTQRNLEKFNQNYGTLQKSHLELQPKQDIFETTSSMGDVMGVDIHDTLNLLSSESYLNGDPQPSENFSQGSDGAQFNPIEESLYDASFPISSLPADSFNFENDDYHLEFNQAPKVESGSENFLMATSNQLDIFTQWVPKRVNETALSEFTRYAKIARAAYCQKENIENKDPGIIAFSTKENDLENGLKPSMSTLGYLIKYLKKNQQWKAIYFIGFGFSAVFAELTAVALKHFLPKSVQLHLYSFGKPRVGNGIWATHVGQIAISIRFTNQHDLVVRLPIASNDKEKYVHCGTEIWNSSPNGPVYSCPEVEVPGGLIENENCVKKEGKAVAMDNLGPYFGVLMNQCREDDPVSFWILTE